MKTTKYFDALKMRSDGSMIKDEWILRVVKQPESELIQSDGRIRRWARISRLLKFYSRGAIRC